MNKFAERFLPYMLTLFLVLASFLSRSSVALAQEQNVQVIELTAKKYEYSPSPFHVKAGTKVQLKITATDHDHGFKIPLVPDGAEPSGKPGLVLTSPQDCWQLKKGQTTTIEFLAASVRDIYVSLLPCLRPRASRHEGPDCRGLATVRDQCS